MSKIDEQMNYDKKFTMVYSGVENKNNFQTLYDLGVRNFLMSYHYLKNKASVENKRDDIKFFIDSGAHTFQNGEEYQDWEKEDWETYIEEYLDWVEKNQDMIFAIADLDIHQLVGYSQVEEWRKKYFEPFMVRTGIPVCFVWHTSDGLEGWERMCERYPYVGISWVADELGDNQAQSMFNTARQHNTLVHGFGMTQTSLLPKLPFYTVDSSVTGDSSILVKDKIRNEVKRLDIEEFYNLQEEYSYRTSDVEERAECFGYETLTVDSNNNVVWEKLKAVVKHTVTKDLYKFKVEGGREVTCTDDHSILTMDKEGNLVETKANQLKEGDYMLAPMSYSNEQPKAKEVVTTVQEKNYSKKKLKELNIRLTDEFLQFLGLWVGDGCYYKDDKGTIGLSCYQDSECKAVIDKVSEQFNCNPYVSPNGIDVRLSCINLKRVMINLGFNGESSTKFVPSFIYSLDKAQIAQFLRGYFSADGTGVSCECSTVSEKLKDDLVELLTMFNIFTSVSYYPSKEYNIMGKEGITKGIWRVTIRDRQSKLKFLDKIKFLQDYKNSDLKETINNISNKNNIRNARRHCIPVSLLKDDRIYYSNGRSEKLTSQKRVGRNINDDNFNNKVVDNDLLFLEIKEIEKVSESKEVEVYDLSVDNYERFFANGLLVHNTTWMVGMQYGELSYWTGNKMKRLKKDKWNEYKGKLEKLGIDFEKLKNEEKKEVIKANIVPFQQAEQYIRERLDNKMYWLGSISATTNRLDSDVFPSLDWLSGETQFDNWKQYAQNLNIKVQQRSAGINAVIDAVMFSHWEKEDYQDFIENAYLAEEGVIESLHDFYINEVVEGREQMLEDLRDYFTKVVTGEEILDLSGGAKRAEEREEYVTEDRYDYEDISKEEVLDELSNLLPSADDEEDPHPDISELDDEIFDEAGIQPVRDEKGRFVKGQKKVRKPKNIYSKKYPKLSCDTCYAAQTCPEFESGKVCAFNKMFDRFDTRDMGDIVEAMQGMVNLNLKRMQRVAIFEQLDGGMPDGNLTQLIDQNMNLLNKLKEIYKAGDQEVLRRTMVKRADGTMEETIEAKNPQDKGILSQLFAGESNRAEKEEEKEEPIDITEESKKAQREVHKNEDLTVDDEELKVEEEEDWEEDDDVILDI